MSGRPPLRRPEKEVLREHLDNGLTHSWIAKRYNTERDQVRKWLWDYGLWGNQAFRRRTAEYYDEVASGTMGWVTRPMSKQSSKYDINGWMRGAQWRTI
jgi:hypothetical protein